MTIDEAIEEERFLAERYRKDGAFASAKAHAEIADMLKLIGDLMLCRRNNCLTCEHGRICDLKIEERVRKFGIEVSQ